ncbi:hypothetical protein [Aequorivita marina]|uniref:hypothetical protein n=1 Tax=Aequorivita marina TaxID=3073654 RepID=UPI002874C8FE|nr:hypothetical protein [Aequorivita sp. S2608]MDS1297287.1 hypothetical protein [Aequorivita sp. S2608]
MFLKLGFILFCAIVISCGPVQNSTEDAETNSASEIEMQKIEGEKMMAAGFIPGRIIYSDLADDCEYTIQLKEGRKDFYYVDPINLSEEFSNDGQTVWVKLNWLRRMSRCEKAVPVEITEIKDRRE